VSPLLLEIVILTLSEAEGEGSLYFVLVLLSLIPPTGKNKSKKVTFFRHPEITIQNITSHHQKATTSPQKTIKKQKKTSTPLYLRPSHHAS
jgi:hypothetical protein